MLRCHPRRATQLPSPSVESFDAVASNARIIERENESGEIFIAQTRVRGRLAIRVAIGNIRTTEAHARRAWQLLREAGDAAL